MSYWSASNRAAALPRAIADRHYNRQKVGARQFVPPGRCLVLWAPGCAWITSWPYARYVKHAWAGARVNSLFRREDGPLASDLIREAVAITRWKWGDAPDADDRDRWVPCEYLPPKFHGPIRHHPLSAGVPLVSFVDATKTRKKRDPGRCYRRCGFKHVGFTKAGLWAFLMLPSEMPEAQRPRGELEIAA